MGPLLVAAGRDVCPGATPAPPPLLFPFACVIVVDEVIVAVWVTVTVEVLPFGSIVVDMLTSTTTLTVTRMS